MGFFDSLWKNWGKKDVKGWSKKATKTNPASKVKKTIKKKKKSKK